MKQKPSFQFYPQDFLGSLSVQTMSAEEVGVYCLLIFNCFNNGGTLPNNLTELSILCRGIKPSEKVMQNFYISENVLRHKRIDEEMIKWAKFSKEQKAKARKRWLGADKKPMPRHTRGNAESMPEQSPRGQCSSSSSSSSSNNSSLQSELFGGDSPTPTRTMGNFIFMVTARTDEYHLFVQKIAQSKKIPPEVVRREVDKFLNYWCEKTRDGKKEKWQIQKTFEVQRRLSTWFLNVTSGRFGHSDNLSGVVKIR